MYLSVPSIFTPLSYALSESLFPNGIDVGEICKMKSARGKVDESGVIECKSNNVSNIKNREEKEWEKMKCYLVLRQL